MGCDIHVHTEVKINGKWHHYSIPSVARMYELFAKLCGVRRNYDDEIQPISEPKGLPHDATELTLIDAERWKADGHSHSWLGKDEIRQLEVWYADFARKSKIRETDIESQFGYLFGDVWREWNKQPQLSELSRLSRPKVEDFRFVFWFDN